MLFCFTCSAQRLINWAPKMRSAVGGDQLNISVVRSGSYVNWRTGRQSALGQRDELNKMQYHTAKWWLLSSYSAWCRATLILRVWKAPWGRAPVLHPAGFPLLTAPDLLCRARVAFPFAKLYAPFTLCSFDLFAASATVQQLFIFSLNYLLSLSSASPVSFMVS